MNSIIERTGRKKIRTRVSLPAINASEFLQLRFQQWFSYGGNDAGQIQISVQVDNGGWSEWVDVGNRQENVSDWSLMSVDLSDYAGQTARIAFYHTAHRHFSYQASESMGWYIDGVKIVSR